MGNYSEREAAEWQAGSKQYAAARDRACPDAGLCTEINKLWRARCLPAQHATISERGRDQLTARLHIAARVEAQGDLVADGQRRACPACAPHRDSRAPFKHGHAAATVRSGNFQINIRM